MSIELSPVLREIAPGLLSFWCPACEQRHALKLRTEAHEHPSWIWNGNAERPTFEPSIHVQARYKADPDDPTDHDVDFVCHSFVRDGQIQFLGDCTHALANQIVALPTFPVSR